MPIRKTVRRGDSLWSLACRYLGGGERYPQIYDFHNQEAARYGLRPIEKPDLIFVGQTILIPPRPKVPKPGNGTKAVGNHWPIPLNLKVTYTIGKDMPPIVYMESNSAYTITTEMSGSISIENTTPGHFRYVHNYEMAFSKDSMKTKQKLHDTTDPALVALTAKPEMVYKSKRVKIKATIAAAANLGPYAVEVSGTPMHMSGTIKPPPINGELTMGKRKYKYSADIEFKVDVVLHQKPKRPETVKVPELQRENVVRENSKNSIDWAKVGKHADEIIALVTITILSYFFLQIRISMTGSRTTTSFIPFHHSIDPRH